MDLKGDVNKGTPELKFCLYQNYPNPFNSVTNLKFHVASSGHIRLIIFDLLGRKVATLVDEVKEPGEYEIKFNSDVYGLTSGIYLYQMRANGFISTRKFILIK